MFLEALVAHASHSEFLRPDPQYSQKDSFWEKSGKTNMQFFDSKAAVTCL
jgi:hypothetical protein